MQKTVTENYVWLQDGLLVEVQDSGIEATVYYCSSHCNTDGQSLHQGRQECISGETNIEYKKREPTTVSKKENALERELRL